MNPADFPKLMADVKQFQAVLEQIYEMASNPMEKELLGAAIGKDLRQRRRAESRCPARFQVMDDEAKRLQTEAETFQEEFAKKQVEIDALKEEDDRREAARKAAQPPLSELYGPMAW